MFSDVKCRSLCDMINGAVKTHCSDLQLTKSYIHSVLCNSEVLCVCLCLCVQQLQGVWAADVTDGTCVAVNNKYRLMAFGSARYVSVCNCLSVSSQCSVGR